MYLKKSTYYLDVLPYETWRYLVDKIKYLMFLIADYNDNKSIYVVIKSIYRDNKSIYLDTKSTMCVLVRRIYNDTRAYWIKIYQFTYNTSLT